jgi:hypothetical protein
MPWKHNGRIIKVGKSWTDDSGVTHPSNWTVWDDATKAARQVIWEPDPVVEPYDKRFFWSAGNPKDLVQLQATWTEKTKATAGSLLAPTDWYVVRYSETTTAIPTTVLDYRAAIRTASNAIEAAIATAADHAAFVALFDTPVDADGVPTGNAPIHDWPVDPNADPSMP